MFLDHFQDDKDNEREFETIDNSMELVYPMFF